MSTGCHHSVETTINFPLAKNCLLSLLVLSCTSNNSLFLFSKHSPFLFFSFPRTTYSQFPVFWLQLFLKKPFKTILSFHVPPSQLVPSMLNICIFVRNLLWAWNWLKFQLSFSGGLWRGDERVGREMGTDCERLGGLPQWSFDLKYSRISSNNILNYGELLWTGEGGGGKHCDPWTLKIILKRYS